MNPYSELPPSAFWKTGVTQENPYAIDNIYKKKFDIKPNTQIATAGSCFGQHVGNHLKRNGYQVIDEEIAPAGLPDELHQKYGFSLYSARYGNIYTVKQLLQLAQEVAGERKPSNYIWKKNGKYFDALRPAVEPEGHDTEQEVIDQRDFHIKKVKNVFTNMNLFIFTLGLTEMWVHKESGTVYPTAPGTICGEFQEDIYEFKNAQFQEIINDFNEFQKIVRQIRSNKSFQILLTVSPVPLTATASGNHILVSTVHSKSILRAVAGQLAARSHIDYFPSYEIVHNPRLHSTTFKENLRSVRDETVQMVMNHFFAEHQPLTSIDTKIVSKNQAPSKSEEDIPCEDALLEQFSTEEKNKKSIINISKNRFEFDSIEDFLSIDNISNGIYCIKNACSLKHASSSYPLFFRVKNASLNAPLACSLHGAFARKSAKLPAFSSHTIVLGNAAMTIDFCDPLLYSGEVNVGWFTLQQDDPVTLISQCIKHICDIFSPRIKVISGGSSGGFACLRISKKITDADYFIWNPQTNILNYNSRHIKEYACCISGLSDVKIDSFFESAKLEYELEVKSIISNIKGKIYYFQQLGDWHVKSHLFPFLKPILKYNYEEFNSFISSKPSKFLNKNLYLHVGDWRINKDQGSHIAPTPKLIKDVLNSIVLNGRIDQLALNSYDTNL